MRRQILVLAVLAAIPAATHADSKIREDSIAWASSFEEAKKIARERKQLVMIEFYTKNCSWCQKLDKEVLSRTEVIHATRGFSPVRFDADVLGEGERLDDRYSPHIKGYPAFLFIDPDNEVCIASISGYLPPWSLSDRLALIEDTPTDLEKLRTIRAEFPGERQHARELFTALALRKKLAEADLVAQESKRLGLLDQHWARGYQVLANGFFEMERFPQAYEAYLAAEQLSKRPLNQFQSKLGMALTLPYLGNSKDVIPNFQEAAQVANISDGEKKFAEELLADYRKKKGQ